MTIAAILKTKGSHVVTISRTATLAEVTATLASRGIGLVVVLSSSGVLDGVVSERDVIRRLAAHGPVALTMTAEQTMTRGVTTASPRTTIDQAMSMMTLGNFRHLPVMDNGTLVGLISMRDVVRAKVGVVETEVQSLRAYVAGDYVATGTRSLHAVTG